MSLYYRKDGKKEPSNAAQLIPVISKRRINNTPYSCLCDILKKKYHIKESCNKVIGQDMPIAVSMSDSVDTVFKEYEKGTIEQAQQTREYGMVFTFSKVYMNTILVTIFYRCPGASIDMGRVITYYFILNDEEEVVEFYRGVIHYN